MQNNNQNNINIAKLQANENRKTQKTGLQKPANKSQSGAPTKDRTTLTVSQIKQIQQHYTSIIKPNMESYTVSNKGKVAENKHYVCHVNRKTITLTLQHPQKKVIEYTFSNGTLKVNGNVKSAKAVAELIKLIQHIGGDIAKKKAVVYEKEREG
ncbi:MAG: hypothetical protein ACON35_05365 [Candidatus Marinamargulisbacteria bacterium]